METVQKGVDIPPSGPGPGPGRPTCVTPIQAAAYETFMRTLSESETARQLGLSQIRVRECLVQYQRNLLRDAGLRPPPLREMLRGDVSTRFDVARDVRGGRPAKHARAVSLSVAGRAEAVHGSVGMRRVDPPRAGVRRFVVTVVQAGAQPHSGFLANLVAYAAHGGAELLALERGAVCGVAPLDLAGRLHVRTDVAPPLVAKLPLEGLQHVSRGCWAAFPHPVQQLESLPRVAALPPRIQLTTGAATVHRDAGRGAATRLGALVVEMVPDGRVFARTVSAAADGDGSFRDLDLLVSGGVVTTGEAVAGLVLGDLHLPLADAAVVEATWGTAGLVARLRPEVQVVHDLCDFRARGHHERRDHHRRFVHHVRGRDDVRVELAEAVRALGAMRTGSGRIAVVHSNHDDFLLRWLREGDHRADPRNAEFMLDLERSLHARLRAGTGTATFFAETMRSLSPDGLVGVRFLADGESLPLGGVECGVHGHAGPDGCRGSVAAFDRLGVDMVLGHFHQPAVRGGIHVAGVCRLDLGYGRGPTSWAVAHVACHRDGARQHLFLHGDRFAA